MHDVDFSGQLAKALKISGVLLALLCLIYLVFLPGNPYILGLVVGTAAGIVGAFFLGKRMSVAANSDGDQGKIQLLIGVIFRLLFIIVVIYVASRFEQVNLFATAGGIFVVQGVFMSIAGTALGSGGVSEGGSVNNIAEK